jgi:hypothetical protein
VYSESVFSLLISLVLKLKQNTNPFPKGLSLSINTSSAFGQHVGTFLQLHVPSVG